MGPAGGELEGHRIPAPDAWRWEGGGAGCGSPWRHPGVCGLFCSKARPRQRRASSHIGTNKTLGDKVIKTDTGRCPLPTFLPIACHPSLPTKPTVPSPRES